MALMAGVDFQELVITFSQKELSLRSRWIGTYICAVEHELEWMHLEHLRRGLIEHALRSNLNVS